MATHPEDNHKRLVLISDDAEFASMAKGAISAGNQQELEIIPKPMHEVGVELREINCDCLIVDLDASKAEEFEHLQKIKRMVGSSCAVLVITSGFSPAAARILFQLKVSDFLVKPVQTSELVRACNNVLKSPGDETQVEPQFLSFMPASGGVGCTVLALETAQILNRHGASMGRHTCVVDLNFQQGSCAEYLDLEPRFDITEIENAPERLDRQLLDVMLSKHESGLSIIAAPYQPSEMRSFKAALVVRLLDLVSAYFDYVVIDLPRIWFPWTETVLMGSNKLFIVADMNVPSIRNAKRLLAAVDEKVGQQVDAKVLVNRMDMRANASGLNASDVEAALGEAMAGGIPNNYGLVRGAVDRGVPLHEVEANNNVSNALHAIIIASDVEQPEREDGLRGILSAGKQFFRKAS